MKDVTIKIRSNSDNEYMSMKNKEYCDYNILIMALETLREQVVDNHKQYNYVEDLSRLKRIATELERVRCSESYDQNTM